MLISKSLINILTRLKVVFNVKTFIILYFYNIYLRNRYMQPNLHQIYLLLDIYKYNTNTTIAVALIWIKFYTQYYYLI